ncbi:4-alpha-glucanotransferase [Limnoglobus roseus]|uniref:4-alpha-glucanotransferase n=1 Tax=Limnoglobus roseus TaxID=2598579 RepID=A0A5C1AFN7_9BACT|nr:4-alpha-glucanotransferase [Limnoglobus roseus]QEL18071.1 GH77 - retaining 4-alpha-glucanotransferase [Limnoglobus roseus]
MLVRSSGLLLHPTSLPSPFGVGDIGPTAYRWVDTLAAMKQSWWQILPLGPTGFGDSPYQSFSAFAGNVNLLSPELLERDGLLPASAWSGRWFPDEHFDSVNVVPFKAGLLQQAWQHFHAGHAPKLRTLFEEYCHREQQWLDDYALFMAVRTELKAVPLVKWPADLIRREPKVLQAAKAKLRNEIELHQFCQFLFDRQWTALRAYAAAKKIRIIGDIPIFVSGDSADVWANPKLFLVDGLCKPSVVAGVPPDYFSADGQHWGNPIYDWKAMHAEGYAWWIARVRQTLKQVDLIRLDHFRGFAQAWHIPAADTNARNGKWVDGPGRKLFDAIQARLGSLPFIAEDLGVITPDVDSLRESLGLPGMRVLQFALDTPKNQYLPCNYVPDTIAYTGTHDNDTTVGWWRTLNGHDQTMVGEYIGHWVHEPAWEMMRLAWGSVAKIAVAPVQDVIAVGSEGRMNVPGKAAGNWKWRMRWADLPFGSVDRVADLTMRFNRVPAEPKLSKV